MLFWCAASLTHAWLRTYVIELGSSRFVWVFSLSFLPLCRTPNFRVKTKTVVVTPTPPPFHPRHRVFSVKFRKHDDRCFSNLYVSLLGTLKKKKKNFLWQYKIYVTIRNCTIAMLFKSDKSEKSLQKKRTQLVASSHSYCNCSTWNRRTRCLKTYEHESSELLRRVWKFLFDRLESGKILSVNVQSCVRIELGIKK